MTGAPVIAMFLAEVGTVHKTQIHFGAVPKETAPATSQTMFTALSSSTSLLYVEILLNS